MALFSRIFLFVFKLPITEKSKLQINSMFLIILYGIDKKVGKRATLCLLVYISISFWSWAIKKSIYFFIDDVEISS